LPTLRTQAAHRLDVVGAGGIAVKMAIKVRQLLRMLKRAGWVLDRQRGSQHHFVHPTKPGAVTVAYTQPGDEIPTGTQEAIYEQAGWK
jgi:predicted RNA binding protein YcfA (HicA-like mRNA interferase family)